MESSALRPQEIMQKETPWQHLLSKAYKNIIIKNKLEIKILRIIHRIEYIKSVRKDYKKGLIKPCTFICSSNDFVSKVKVR